MAVTYDFEFKFNPGSIIPRSVRKPNDGISSNANFGVDLGSKFGITLASGTAPSASGGANAGVGKIFSIAASGTLTLDLRAIDLIDDRTAQVLARYKFLVFALLSTAQGGTACSGVEVGNAASEPHQLFLGGDTETFILENGDFLIHGKTGAAGKVIDASNTDVLITNLDGAVAASVLVGVVGGLS